MFEGFPPPPPLFCQVPELKCIVRDTPLISIHTFSTGVRGRKHHKSGNATEKSKSKMEREIKHREKKKA